MNFGFLRIGFLGIFTACSVAPQIDMPSPSLPVLSPEKAVPFARLALEAIQTEYPNKPSHVYANASWARTPADMHPAFYGSFDWHSSVHGHWLLVRLLRLGLLEEIWQNEVISVLDKHLSDSAMTAELAFLQAPQHRSFERMYGWAWYLSLCSELRLAGKMDRPWADRARSWLQACTPMEVEIAARIREYLPKLEFPIRSGEHRDTAFALTHILDWARSGGDASLVPTIEDWARQKYGRDLAWNFSFEPSGQDFLSPGLEVVDLMRRVLPDSEFAPWLAGFWPESLAWDSWHAISLQPVYVQDVTDGKLVHLAGLDLSRAWCLQGLANALPQSDARRDLLLRSAVAHAEAGLDVVFSGHFEGGHWLGTFAVYLLTQESSRSQSAFK